MTYFVYILKCKDGSLYTGITTDLKRRFKEHANKKGGNYTSARGVVRMVYSEKSPNRSAASKREAEIKRWRRERKLDLIKKLRAKVGRSAVRTEFRPPHRGKVAPPHRTQIW